MLRKYSRLLVITLLLAGMLLAGCDSESSATTLTTTAATTVATTAAPTPTPTVAPTPTPALPSDPLVESFFGPLPTPAQSIPFEHNEVRAIYLGAAANIDAAIEICNTTEVNAVVIDLKESNGVKFNCTVPLAVEIGVVKAAYDLGSVVEKFHAQNILVIGRIVCFKDPQLAEAKPDLTIQDANGTPLIYSLEDKKMFVSPFNQTVWQYNVDIAVEAISYGVDEIQFDYVRFPTGGSTTGARSYYGPEGTVPKRVQAINRFLRYACIRIQDECGVPLSADVFGICIISENDGVNLGQNWSLLGMTGVDSVCPMLYPSHFANASKGNGGNGVGQDINGVTFTKPDLEPYNVMYQSLLASKKAFEQPGYIVAVRPYLQAFTASYLPDDYHMTYDAAAISKQIQAVYDAGYSEWICWNAKGEYPIEAFAPES